MNKIDKYIRLAFVILSLSILVSGCGQAFQDLLPLRDKIVEKYHENNVSLSINNGSAIGVSFINSSFNDLESAQKKEKAKEIALFVKENYGSMDNIDMIFVSFTIHKTYFFIVNYTNSLDTFFFKIDELNSANP